MPQLPSSFLQMTSIFISIIIEALPFVMIGCIITGFLQSFLTPERVKKILPKNKFLSVLVGTGIGFFFPSCECGIIPIVNQFIKKGVPTYTAFAFMLTAPIINPIVMFSTYIAFNNNWKMVGLRSLGSFIVAVIVGCWLAYFHKGTILKNDQSASINEEVEFVVKNKVSAKQKILHALQHSIDEFFDTGRYLILGAIIAAAMQTYLKTATLLSMGSTKFTGILIMLLFSFIISLCSEADAFIGSSLFGLFGIAPITAFLVFGPMVDIKNLLMMSKHFKLSFIAKLIGIICFSVIGYSLFL